MLPSKLPSHNEPTATWHRPTAILVGRYQDHTKDEPDTLRVSGSGERSVVVGRSPDHLSNLREKRHHRSQDFMFSKRGDKCGRRQKSTNAPPSRSLGRSPAFFFWRPSSTVVHGVLARRLADVHATLIISQIAARSPPAHSRAARPTDLMIRIVDHVERHRSPATHLNFLASLGVHARDVHEVDFGIMKTFTLRLRRRPPLGRRPSTSEGSGDLPRTTDSTPKCQQVDSKPHESLCEEPHEK